MLVNIPHILKRNRDNRYPSCGNRDILVVFIDYHLDLIPWIDLNGDWKLDEFAVCLIVDLELELKDISKC